MNNYKTHDWIFSLINKIWKRRGKWADTGGPASQWTGMMDYKGKWERLKCQKWRTRNAQAVCFTRWTYVKDLKAIEENGKEKNSSEIRSMTARGHCFVRTNVHMKGDSNQIPVSNRFVPSLCYMILNFHGTFWKSWAALQCRLALDSAPLSSIVPIPKQFVPYS